MVKFCKFLQTSQVMEMWLHSGGFLVILTKIRKIGYSLYSYQGQIRQCRDERVHLTKQHFYLLFIDLLAEICLEVFKWKSMK